MISVHGMEWLRIRGDFLCCLSCRAAVFIALCFGVSLSPCGHVTKSFWWWLIGGAGFLSLYHLPTWTGFAGTKNVNSLNSLGIPFYFSD